MEPLTAGVIVTLAFTKVFETTIEKFTEAALAKMDRLRQRIWDKLQGNPKVQNAIAAVEQGSKADLERVAAYLQVEMNEDDNFAQEVETLAREIQQEINIGKLQAQPIQNVYGGEAEQNNAISTNAPVIQGGRGHNLTFN
jgi:hypothetical protein